MADKFDIEIPISVKGEIGGCNYSGLEKRFCEMCKKNIKNNVNIEDMYANICLDCVLFEVTGRILSKFINKYFIEVFKNELKKLDPSWVYLEKKNLRS